jgi:hypothetical protein
MTRRYCEGLYLDSPVRVTLGYDRPLDEFFLQIARIPHEEIDDADISDDPYLYVSLADPDALRDDLEYFRSKLTELEIAVPESLFLAVTQDAIEGIGNLVAEHFADGRIVVHYSE